MFERKATCRFDCAPPDVDQIPVGTFLQTYPHEKTKLISRVHTETPEESVRGIIRTVEPGEVFCPTVGPAVRYETHWGSYVS
eukprot:5188373-Pyramimonas_sp.AAC.1